MRLWSSKSTVIPNRYGTWLASANSISGDGSVAAAVVPASVSLGLHLTVLGIHGQREHQPTPDVIQAAGQVVVIMTPVICRRIRFCSCRRHRVGDGKVELADVCHLNGQPLSHDTRHPVADLAP